MGLGLYTVKRGVGVSELPSGTVTFLFTDIEGSTRLWEEFPDAMRGRWRARRAVRAAIEAHGGHVVKTTGDGFHAAFATAAEAIGCCGRRAAVGGGTWGETGPLLVRIGVHTGAAQARDGDYYGTALNRAARLMRWGTAAGVGVGARRRDWCTTGLPDGCTLVGGVGEHRLQDLGRAEVLFQVVHPVLRAVTSRRLRTVDAFPGNLPVQVAFVRGARRRSRTGWAEALVMLPVVTLRVLVGSGKTRLALQVAAEVLSALSR